MDAAVPLTVAGLSKTWRGPLGGARMRALDDVSFDVAAGRVLGLIGPNGSGKTTAIRCILGLVAPSRGESKIFGARPLTRLARRDVGFAPEFFEPSAVRTGRETLRLLGTLSGLSRDDRENASRSLLERFELTEAADRRIGSWSKGMRRRLAIAQAMAGEPKLILLDEPFDGLDPLGALLVREEIASRAARGAAVLLSSHQLADVEAVATDLVVLDRGRVVAQGELSAVLDKKGVSRLEVEGLDDPALAALEGEIASHGGRVIERKAARESLEGLFQRLVKGKKS